VKKLIPSDNAIAIVGEIAHSRSLEAAPIRQEAKIPNGVDGIDKSVRGSKCDYIFRVCLVDPFHGTVMAKFALRNLHVRNVAFSMRHEE
jgi:branched-chain amino acid transport system substrate-binding protein